jgi:hypothetical protein
MTSRTIREKGEAVAQATIRIDGSLRYCLDHFEDARFWRNPLFHFRTQYGAVSELFLPVRQSESYKGNFTEVFDIRSVSHLVATKQLIEQLPYRVELGKFRRETRVGGSHTIV